MSIPAKMNTLRMVGKILNLVGIAAVIISYFEYLTEKPDLMFPCIFVPIGTSILIAQFFIKNDLWLKHRRLFILLIIIVFYAFPVTTALITEEVEDILTVFYAYSALAVPIMGAFYQEASLSTKKIEKIVFIILFAAIQCALMYYEMLRGEGTLLPSIFISQLLFAGGFIMIIVIEAILCKKKQLTYN
jgi:hypothetical protein